MKFIALILSLVLIEGCKSNLGNESSVRSEIKVESDSQSEMIGLGLNDISISFPLEKQLPGIEARLPVLSGKPDPKSFAPNLPMAEEDGEGFLYATTEAEHFDLMGLKISPPVGANSRRLARTKENMFAEYKLHGLRFVPCANDLEVLGNTAACLHTLQMNWDGPNDNTFHTIYKLSDKEFREILETLVKLHKAASINTEKLPLQTNPVILKEGLDSDYFKGIVGLIHRYARASKLYGVAAMHAFTLGEVWVMDQFLVVNKKLVLIPGGEGSIDDRASSTGEAQATSSELSPNPFTLARRTPIRFFAGSGLSWKKLEAENRKVLGVVNPGLHNVRNIRCASCHTSGIFHDNPKDKFDPLRYTSNYWDLKIPSANDHAASGISIVMFSRGAVSQRVTNETAAAMNFLVEFGYLPKPKTWNEKPTVSKKDLDEVRIVSGAQYRLANPSYPARSCYAAKGEVGASMQGQTCGESSAQVYEFKGELTKMSLEQKDSGLCVELSADGKGFVHARCDENNLKQHFKVTGNIHVARFESLNPEGPKCMETTFEDADFNSKDPSKLRLFASGCAASTMSLQKI